LWSVIDLILHIGSNIGDREENLSTCLRLLNIHCGEIINKSDIYATEAWGIKDQPEFLNQAIHLKSYQSPEDILKNIQKIECIIGKEKEFHWGPRRIDIDIIFYGNEIIETDSLTIPHPMMQKRAFVLLPLMDIIPDYIHPSLKLSIRKLSEDCMDSSYAHKIIVDPVI